MRHACLRIRIAQLGADTCLVAEGHCRNSGVRIFGEGAALQSAEQVVAQRLQRESEAVDSRHSFEAHLRTFPLVRGDERASHDATHHALSAPVETAALCVCVIETAEHRLRLDAVAYNNVIQRIRILEISVQSMSCESPTHNGKLAFHRASLLDRLRHDNRLVHFFFARECAAQTVLVRRNAPRSARHNNAEDQQRLHHFEALAQVQQNK